LIFFFAEAGDSFKCFKIGHAFYLGGTPKSVNFSHPAGGVQVLQKARNLLSDDVKAIFRIAKSNLDALNTGDLGLKRPFGVGECALWARLTGLQFAAQVVKSSQVKLIPPQSKEPSQRQARERQADVCRIALQGGCGSSGF
jgi:hypothetical protein